MRLLVATATLTLTAIAFGLGGPPQGGPLLLVAVLIACLTETFGVRLPHYGTVSFGLVVYLPIATSLQLGTSATLAAAIIALIVREALSFQDLNRLIDELCLDLLPLSLACLTPQVFRPNDPVELLWLSLGCVFISTRRLTLAVLSRQLKTEDQIIFHRLLEATANLRWGILGLALLAVVIAQAKPLLAFALLPVIFSLRKAAIHAWAYLDLEDKSALRQDLKGAQSQVVELSRSLETTEGQRNLLFDLSKEIVRVTSLPELLAVLERQAQSLKLGQKIELLLKENHQWLYLCTNHEGQAAMRTINPQNLDPGFRECWQNVIAIPRSHGPSFFPLPGVGILAIITAFKSGSKLEQLMSVFCSQATLACLSALRFKSLQQALLQTSELNGELESKNHSLKVAMAKLQTSEAKLIEGAKLAAVGQLSAGLAHEINNPLGSIRLGIEATLRKETLSPFSQDLLEKSLKGVSRAQTVIGSLLSYSRAGNKGQVLLDPWEIMQDTYAFLHAALHLQNISFPKPTPGPKIQVLGNPQEVQQILTNLLLNAKDAVAQAAEPCVALCGVLGADGVAYLEVHDNGPGIDPDVMDRLFDPFFTTKPVGKGTGLGLSVSRELAHTQGGQLIALRSETLGGACFRLILPIATGSAPSVRP